MKILHQLSEEELKQAVADYMKEHGLPTVTKEDIVKMDVEFTLTEGKKLNIYLK